jgi:hypothetical protein
MAISNETDTSIVLVSLQTRQNVLLRRYCFWYYKMISDGISIVVPVDVESCGAREVWQQRFSECMSDHIGASLPHLVWYGIIVIFQASPYMFYYFWLYLIGDDDNFS